MTAWTTNQIFAFGAVAVVLLGAANATGSSQSCLQRAYGSSRG